MKIKSRKIVIFFLLLTLVVFGTVLLRRNILTQASLYDADEVTAQNLIALSSQIRAYYETNKKLPENLQDVSTNKDSIYNKVSDKTYQLCDEFKTESKPLLDELGEYDAQNAPNEIGRINFHAKGLDCFEVTMD